MHAEGVPATNADIHIVKEQCGSLGEKTKLTFGGNSPNMFYNIIVHYSFQNLGEDTQ